tara:strand:+ start:1099 stop:1572 length:474 start_codon:yes stop_codon:yes gene_type:complete
MMLRTIHAAGLALAATIAVQAGPALSAGDDVFTVTTDVPFEDAAQAVNDAIVNKGYKVDYHGYVGDMLKRTAEDVGAEKSLYEDAEIFTFCSAVLSRKAMEAEIGDIAYCPYVVFVYEEAAKPGTVTIGHRKLPEGGARDEINAVLDEIVTTASDGF